VIEFVKITVDAVSRLCTMSQLMLPVRKANLAFW
jgi:hypothetical protein